MFASQQMQNPTADTSQGFDRTWLRFYQDSHEGAGMNVYIIVDPANEKKKTSDYTAMPVIGLAADHNYYLLDFVYDRMNLTERTKRLFLLHKKWRPKLVGYEKYGKDSDIEHIEYVQEQNNYRFPIHPLGGNTKKNDRIKRLVPIFENGRFYFPSELYKVDYEGRNVDVIEKFLTEEYDLFPVPFHDDGLDAIARIEDPEFPKVWPRLVEDDNERSSGAYGKRSGGRSGSSWAA